MMPMVVTTREKNSNLTGTAGLGSSSQIISGTVVPVANVRSDLTAIVPAFQRIRVLPSVQGTKVNEGSAVREGFRPLVVRRSRRRSSSTNIKDVVAALPRVTRERLAGSIVVSEKIAAVGDRSAPPKLIGKPGEAASPTQKYYDVDLDEYQV
jgi:hypothetical protein